MYKLASQPFGWEVSNLNSIITTAVDTKFNLRNRPLVKLILKFVGLPHFGARIRAHYLGNLLKQLAPSSEILDAGCGIGLNSFFAARRGFSITGIDSDKEKISSAKQILAKVSFKNVEFSQGNILDLPYNRKFDAVICFEVLEHIKDDATALSEMSRALKNEGTLLLSVPGKGSISRMNQHAKHHFREGYSLGELKSKLSGAGFRIKKVIGIEHTPLGLFLRFTNDTIHKKSLLATTILFFVFFPLAIVDGLFPQIITTQNWVIRAVKK